MTELQKRINDLESKAAEMTMLGKLASEPATRTYNAMQAEDLLALAKTLRRSEVPCVS
jgi:hypothetical protein